MVKDYKSNDQKKNYKIAGFGSDYISYTQSDSDGIVCRGNFSHVGPTQSRTFGRRRFGARPFGRRTFWRRSSCKRKFDLIDTIIISSIPLKLNVTYPLMKMIRFSSK